MDCHEMLGIAKFKNHVLAASAKQSCGRTVSTPEGDPKSALLRVREQGAPLRFTSGVLRKGVFSTS